MTNRSAMSSVLPEVFAQHRISPVSEYPRRLLDALRACAPDGVQDPTVVVLTPGVFNGAYFEHALLARTMGVELVDGTRPGLPVGPGDDADDGRPAAGRRDLPPGRRRVPRPGALPRATRCSAAPGIINAARAGSVTIANAVGNGVADDKLVYTYLPDLMRYYLGEEPILPNVDTWRLEDPGALEEVLDRLAELVVKPVDGSGGKGIVMGPQSTAAELDALRGCACSRTRAAGSPSRWCSSRPSRPWSATGSSRATSTCARSRSTTATTSGCCPAG